MLAAPDPPLTLEQLLPDALVTGIVSDGAVTVVRVDWHGANALTVAYRTSDGRLGETILYREDEPRLAVVQGGRPWSFDGDGALYRLVAEAHRIRLAYLFDPVLAVHSSEVEPLPHQITAVYESMLPQQPLRFLLADDPGAGKTIMAGLYIKELMARGDLKRCLIVSPGSLVEQWQGELDRKFQLPFEIFTNDKGEASRTGNWFREVPLAIARLDKLARDEELQAKLTDPECHYDLVIFDEAHKLAASYFGGEIKYTKRYQLARKLGGNCRHLLLMTATPHNGKEEDFQLFMALLDGDQFEGRPRDGTRQVDTASLMRRMVKENLLRFDGTPLFPERVAYTVPFTLSPGELRLYQEVTQYVREEFNRAERLQDERRAGTVGFALTVLQRRLASSPEAVYQSIRRRRERLEARYRELELLQRDAGSARRMPTAPLLDLADLEDQDELEEAPEAEQEALEAEVLDRATTANTLAELKEEIRKLQLLEAIATDVRNAGTDTKWRELAQLLGEIFGAHGQAARVGEPVPHPKGKEIAPPRPSPRQKLVIFTEHRDTLNYLERQVSRLQGRPDGVVCIHGGMGRQERSKAQERFLTNPDVQVLLATDAAGEGINLQRAHLMVNYDLPWNPNRLEQRFGRIHRIGQTEVCHLWNLVASETREGEVYRKLLEKLEESRTALGGQVFDVLGKLQFDGKPLRELLMEAIRYGEQPEVRARLTQAVEHGVDRRQLEALIEDRALDHRVIDAGRLEQVRADMERAQLRRLQPHYVEGFFLEAFRQLGGTVRQREPRRYEISHVPGAVRSRDRQIGAGAPVMDRYERVVFERTLIHPQGQPRATFVAPGNPLLNAVLDLTLERNREVLRRGAILVDDRDTGTAPRVLVMLEHAVHDATVDPRGERRVISRRLLYVEMGANGEMHPIQYAPYLDYRPLGDGDPSAEALLVHPACAWIGSELERRAHAHAIGTLAQEHTREVKTRRLAWVAKTREAVRQRLTREIIHWDHRAEELRLKQQAGAAGARLNWQDARRRTDDLQARLRIRLEELDRQSQINTAPPVVLGGVVVVPAGLLAQLSGNGDIAIAAARDTQASAARARAAVMAAERALGFEPVDREFERLGYDIESRDPRTGRLRFLEVKGRVAGADTITVTRNEILYSLGTPDDFLLAMVEFNEAGREVVRYLRNPFRGMGVTTEFAGATVNFHFADLWSRGVLPQ